MRTLTSHEVCRHAGITYRQLDYWTRIGTAGTDHQRGVGSGHHRRWTRRQAAVLAVMARFVELGARPRELTGLVLHLMSLPADEWHRPVFYNPSTRAVTATPTGTAGQWVHLQGYAPED